MYISLNNPERRELEEAMKIVRGDNGDLEVYLRARKKALDIAGRFYGENADAKREMNEVYREIGESILRRRDLIDTL